MTTPELQLIYPDWAIVRLLGEGAFGKVYEIRRGEGELEERAALKVIHIPQSESEVKLLQSEGADVSAHFSELARQLSNEIATQAKLKGNSNVVSYEDRKIVPDPDGVGQTILIRMELLTPLVDLMAAGAMGQAQVLQLGIDMARALLLCEHFHIIHRDIKPQNIFISPTGDYKLGDFGVARQLEQTTANLSRKGTYNYMAPEVFHGRPCNATVDIYSLGIVLYTLLNGNRAPFLPSSITGSTVTGHDRESAQTKRLSGEPLPPLPHVPGALNEVILKMCTFEPKDRYQNSHELMTALEGVTYELQGEKTVNLRSWIGDNTPSVAPEVDTVEPERELSRWIDGTPYVPEKEPELESEQTEPTLEKNSVKKKRALIAVIATLSTLLLCAIVGLGIINSIVKKGTAEQILAPEATAQLKDVDCILVLGAKIMPGGTPSHVLEDRMRRAVSLYDSEATPVLLVSGDHGQREYDEVTAMKQYAVDHGVPSSDVFMDHAGFETYDSVYRAKETFQAKRVIIVSNRAHLLGALYIAKQLGMEAWGVSSDYREYVSAPGVGLKGFLERVNIFFKCTFNARPAYIGDPIPLTMDGDVTNDKGVKFTPSNWQEVFYANSTLEDQITFTAPLDTTVATTATTTKKTNPNSEGWKKAYLEILNFHGEKDFYIVDLDNNNVPELLVFQYGHGSIVYLFDYSRGILSYKNGEGEPDDSTWTMAMDELYKHNTDRKFGFAEYFGNSGGSYYTHGECSYRSGVLEASFAFIYGKDLWESDSVRIDKYAKGYNGAYLYEALESNPQPDADYYPTIGEAISKKEYEKLLADFEKNYVLLTPNTHVRGDNTDLDTYWVK